uniref:C-type lectin domain-containing protein n=1 Tax=Sinocyclocheilus grahami TaxID=75366 RepID=A0A672KRE0_SINGR
YCNFYTLKSVKQVIFLFSSAGAPRQYHFVNQMKSWTEAQSYCREKYTDLVTINDIQEQNDIEQAIKSSSDRVWIGLKSTNSWIWSLNCVYMDCKRGIVNEHKGQWHDLDCGTIMHFICYNGEFSCK